MSASDIECLLVGHITNTPVRETTGLTTISEYLSRRRISLFDHVVRMDANVAANGDMRYAVLGGI